MIALSKINSFANRRRLKSIDTLLSWYILNGVNGIGPTAKLNIFQSDNETKSLICNSEIKKEEIIVKFPITLCFFANDETSWNVTLACYILREIISGSPSKWRIYLENLPPLGSDHLEAVSYKAFNHEYLPLISSLRKCRTEIDKAFSNCPLSSHFGVKSTHFSWAMSIVRARAFDLKNVEGQKVHVFIPIVEIIKHGDNLLTMSMHGEKMGRSYSLSTKSPPEAIRKNHLKFNTNCKITKGQKVRFSYSKSSNDFFLMNYGFFPKFNLHDNVVLFEDEIDVYNWWITTFGKELTPKSRSHIIQSILTGITSVSDQARKKRNESMIVEHRKRFFRRKRVQDSNGR